MKGIVSSVRISQLHPADRSDVTCPPEVTPVAAMWPPVGLTHCRPGVVGVAQDLERASVDAAVPRLRAARSARVRRGAVRRHRTWRTIYSSPRTLRENDPRRTSSRGSDGRARTELRGRALPRRTCG